jgi:hypothetical protein
VNKKYGACSRHEKEEKIGSGNLKGRENLVVLDLDEK